MSATTFDDGLNRNRANFAPLSPLTFLVRAAAVYPDRVAVIDGELRRTYAELYARCRRLAGALKGRGLGAGDTVALMAPNTPALIEAHYGVPMAGAVLNALNVRLDAASLAFILEHSETKLLIADRVYGVVIGEALERMKAPPPVIDIDDKGAESFERASTLGESDYEALLGEGSPECAWSAPEDEWRAISLNYTSGTTGKPKGVVYHHRGAYLNALGNILAWDMPAHPTYLWTLPMFHCNGWCFPWTVVALAGTQVCLRRVEAGAVWRAIADHEVSHFCGAPIVLGMLLNTPEAERVAFGHRVRVMTAAAPPPPTVLAGMESMGFEVTHVYGLTETYGPAVVCAWHGEWDALAPQEQAVKRARQGVRYPVLEDLAVMDPQTMEPVPWDGATMGEVMFRGNIVMKGYLKNPRAGEEAFAGGWFHSGDLGVMHADGYIELKDRSKDIIISGGENISTIEVESVLYKHAKVLEAAVVARPDEKWGETPCAFVTLKEGARGVSEADIIAFCREHMAHFKAPKTVLFGPLPKTSTGKVQKYLLRDRAREL